jgi:hypothetical protein
VKETAMDMAAKNMIAVTAVTAANAIEIATAMDATDAAAPEAADAAALVAAPAAAALEAAVAEAVQVAEVDLDVAPVAVGWLATPAPPRAWAPRTRDGADLQRPRAPLGA